MLAGCNAPRAGSTDNTSTSGTSSTTGSSRTSSATGSPANASTTGTGTNSPKPGGTTSASTNGTINTSTTGNASTPGNSSANGTANTSTSGNVTNGSSGGNATNASSRGSKAKHGASYYIEQGSQCIPVRPFTGKKSAKQYYAYRTPSTNPPGQAYGSLGTKSLQRANTSALLLYRSHGKTSLVIVHGDLSGTSGGSATFTFEGLPKGGTWTVRDDSYDGSDRFDQWNLSGSSSQVDWTWGKNKADGAVYTGLGDHPQITIKPAFNERATLYGKHYDGKIKQWQVISNENGQPVRHNLDLTKPITISDHC